MSIEYVDSYPSKQTDCNSHDEILQNKDKVESILDDYESIQGLSNLTNPGTNNDLNSYLTMDRSQLKALSLTDCSEIAYVLAEYSFYVQRLYNKESATLYWAEKQLLELTCTKLDQFDKYMKHDIKLHCIAKENDVVNKILRIISYGKQVMERLSFLSTRLNNMAERLNGLQIAKTSQLKAMKYE